VAAEKPSEKDSEAESRSADDRKRKHPRQSPLLLDGISYIPSSVVLSGIAKLSIKDDRAFAVVDTRGEAPRTYSDSSELGIYYNDTRYLSVWELWINGESPIPLAQQLRPGGNTLVLSMTNPDIWDLRTGERIARDTLLIRRVLTFCEDGLYENLIIRNFDSVAHVVAVEHWAGGKCDDIFEVRGFTRLRRGRELPPRERPLAEGPGRETTLSYEGLDGRVRSSQITRLFGCRTLELASGLSGVAAEVELPSKLDAQLKTAVSFDRPWSGLLRGRDFAALNVPDFIGQLEGARKARATEGVRIRSDNAILNRAIDRALIDIRTLLSTEGDGLLYPYAGIPWFSAPFGRDGLITAYQLLPWFPDLARGVLDYVWSTQGRAEDAFTDEQPGKIFHELRRGEMAVLREVPFIPYYGSVDSTPLALILLHQYFRWTGDRESLERWWPHALRAIEWMDRWGDCDGDELIEYVRRSPTGLVNQGWKDSHDSIMHADGRLAEAPIRLCEVQAYAYRARLGMSELARHQRDERLAERLRFQSLRLKALFLERFWNPEGQYLNLAIDGAGAPCQVRSSNMGHALWTGILDAPEARRVTEHLMSDALFSGHGIRTLADTEKNYNPLSYHNGSVWPHDNSLIVEGFRNYGQRAALGTLSEALLGVIEASPDLRLPELFCGFRKRGDEPPVPYQVACKPQAWAAGSLFLLIKAMTGLSIELHGRHLVFHAPCLTSRVGWLEIKGLRGRGWKADLRVRATRDSGLVDLLGSEGDVRVLTLQERRRF
jgi:glycogen debranching enzyme